MKILRNSPYAGNYVLSDDSRYQIYDDGRIWDRLEERLVPQKVDKTRGYLILPKSIYGTRWAHRVIAIAFIPNPDNLPQINHKDECKTNNNVSNLEWCTGSYNVRYGKCIERRANTRRANKLKEIKFNGTD